MLTLKAKFNLCPGPIFLSSPWMRRGNWDFIIPLLYASQNTLMQHFGGKSKIFLASQRQTIVKTYAMTYVGSDIS